MTPTPSLLLRDFSDRLSPMVVKEMRQGLRTRFFTGALMIFHLVLGLLMAGFLFDLNHNDAHEMFWGIIAATLLGVLPLRAFNTLHTESKDGTLDMLVLTGISSFRIVWGKWVSLYSQTLLIACSLLPYLIARYQIGGVELVREALALVVLVLGSALVTAALVAISTQRLLLVRLSMTAAVGIPTTGLGLFTTVLASEKSTGDHFMQELARMRLAESLSLILGVIGLAIYLSYVSLSIGSARLPLVSDSQRVIKRITAFAVLAVLTGLAVLLEAWGYAAYQIIMCSYLPAMLVTILCGMDFVTEELPPQGRPSVNSTGQPTWFLQSGWASGVGVTCLMWLFPLSILLVHHWSIFPSMNAWDLEPWFWAVGLLAATLVPACMPFFRHSSLLAQWWVLQLIMLAVGIMIAIGIDQLPYDDRADYGFLGLITPTTCFFSVEAAPSPERTFLRSLGFVTHLAWIFAALLLATRARRHQFRPYTASPTVTPNA